MKSLGDIHEVLPPGPKTLTYIQNWMFCLKQLESCPNLPHLHTSKVNIASSQAQPPARSPEQALLISLIAYELYG